MRVPRQLQDDVDHVAACRQRKGISCWLNLNSMSVQYFRDRLWPRTFAAVIRRYLIGISTRAMVWELCALSTGLKKNQREKETTHAETQKRTEDDFS